MGTTVGVRVRVSGVVSPALNEHRAGLETSSVLHLPLFEARPERHKEPQSVTAAVTFGFKAQLCD